MRENWDGSLGCFINVAAKRINKPNANIMPKSAIDSDIQFLFFK